MAYVGQGATTAHSHDDHCQQLDRMSATARMREGKEQEEKSGYRAAVATIRSETPNLTRFESSKLTLEAGPIARNQGG